MQEATSEATQAEIEGLQGHGQIRAANRLRFLNISPKLIDAAMAVARDSPEYHRAEGAIILQAMELWAVEANVAVEILNGKMPCPTANHH